MNKLDKNKKKKHEALLNTSFDLFTKKGFSRTSISEIAEKAGVAKGTFYLYFKDKFDLRDELIAYKSRQVIQNAVDELDKHEELEFMDRIIFVTDNIVNQLSNDEALLKFISKNLSWGIFKNELITGETDEKDDSPNFYDRMLVSSPKKLRDPEIMLFMIVELISSSIYSTVVFNEPSNLDEFKPYLYSAVRNIVHDHETE